MTLSTTTTKVTYNGDGSTTAFAVSFIFWNNSDLRVIHRDALGVETVWVEATQYTLTGGSGATGTLTVKTSPTDYTPASGETLTIKDYQSEVQGDSLPLSGAFPSTVVEQRLDKITRLIQIHSEEIARSILLPETASLSGLQLPEPGAGELVRYNAGGTDLETVAVGDISTAIDILLTGLATNDFLYWDNALSAWLNLAPGATGLALLQDASAADALTTLGLGTAAVVDTGVADGNVPAMDATGYPAADGSQISNVVAAWANITGVPADPFTAALLHVRDEQSSGVDGGTSTSVTWHTRDINTEKTNELAGCGLAWELAYDAQTANFVVGQTLTGGTSGATATIVADTDAGATGTLKVINITGVFVDNETITDGVGGSATSDIVAGVVAANQIYLAAATYWIEAISVQSDSYQSRLRLRDVDGAATVLSGINGGSQGGTGTNDSNLLFGVFTLASGKLLEFQLWVDTGRTSDGLGKAVSSGEVEIYTSAMIWKRN